MADRADREVFYFARFVPAYRVPILERLNERLKGRLVVCAGDPPVSSSFQSLSVTSTPSVPKTPLYPCVHLSNWWVGGERLHIQRFGTALSEAGPGTVIIAEESPRSLSLPFFLRRAAHRQCPVILWGHFSSNTRPRGKSTWRDRYRMRLASSATAVLAYTEEIASFLGAELDSSRIFVARNTLDTDTLFRLHTELAREGKAAVRNRLGLPSDSPVVAFIGRLIKEKRVDLLVDSVAGLHQPGATLVVIGDGPERSRIERAGKLHDLPVLFTGALPDLSESAPYLFASDVLLNPGYLGLSVVHAFSLGLPVVAPAAGADIRYHSPEWIYLQSGENGLFVASAGPKVLAAAMEHVLDDQERFSEAAYAYAQSNLQMDAMVDGIMDAIAYAAQGHRATATVRDHEIRSQNDG